MIKKKTRDDYRDPTQEEEDSKWSKKTKNYNKETQINHKKTQIILERHQTNKQKKVNHLKVSVSRSNAAEAVWPSACLCPGAIVSLFYVLT